MRRFCFSSAAGATATAARPLVAPREAKAEKAAAARRAEREALAHPAVVAALRKARAEGKAEGRSAERRRIGEILALGDEASGPAATIALNTNATATEARTRLARSNPGAVAAREARRILQHAGKAN